MPITKRLTPNFSFPRTLLLLVSFLLIYEAILYISVGLRQPLFADEGHFIETITYFHQDISLEHLKTYNEMSTPLPFLLYAIWGKVAGFQTHQLRFLSLIIAFCTFISFFILFYQASRRTDISLLLTLFLIFQPYMIGLTVFVYTDMLAIFFLAWALLAVHYKSPMLLFISLAGAVLCRQYFIFLPAAMGVFYLLKFIQGKSGKSRQMIGATILSIIPLLLLLVLWQGFSPQNEVRQIYLRETLHFHPGFLILYISIFVVYLFPVILYRWRFYYTNSKKIFTSLLLSPLYFLWPVSASAPAQAVNVFTVGFFHKFVRLIVGHSYEHLIFYLAFLLSLPVVFSIIQDIYLKLKSKNFSEILLLDLSIVFFLIIMPFSYLNWEKYFLPIVPLAVMQIINGDLFRYFSKNQIEKEKYLL